jgi:hypothetical protein
MAKFWMLVLVSFVVLLLAVTHVSKRSAQVEAAEEDRAPAAAPPVPEPRAYAAPRSYSPPATANALYKCVDASGHQSFQSQPCASGATQAWVRDATPAPEPRSDETRRRAREERLAQQQAASSSHESGQSSRTHSNPQAPGSSAACQAARAADAAYRRQPLRYVTHDGLRRLGDQVSAACY